MEKSANGKAGPAKAGPAFELIGGHPAIDLVNTLDWRFRESGTEELLVNYGDFLRFAQQSGVIAAAEARRLGREVSENKGARVTAAVRELREAAAEVLYASLEKKSPPAATIKTLEAKFEEFRSKQRLVWQESKLGWEFDRLSAGAELPLYLLSVATAELMGSDAIEKLRECGNAECRWLFLDTSKNHTRRWCDMKICGNRMKARRFKAQHAR